MNSEDFDHVLADPEALGMLMRVAERGRLVDLDLFGVTDKRSFLCGLFVAIMIHLNTPSEWIQPFMAHPVIQELLDSMCIEESP